MHIADLFEISPNNIIYVIFKCFKEKYPDDSGRVRGMRFKILSTEGRQTADRHVAVCDGDFL